MEVTSVCIRLLMLEFILLGVKVQSSYAQKSDFLRVTPNRLQHFQMGTISFDCEGSDGSIRLRANRNKGFDPECDVKRTPTGSTCTIYRAYPGDSGEYWCETEVGNRSDSVNITVTDGPVILEIPALPVLEGSDVTLHCKSKKNFSNLTAYFYKDDVLMENSPAEEMTILNVSKSDEGFYKCYISGVGESARSLLAVRAHSVILDSPVLPVKKGTNVTLRCRKKVKSSDFPAFFYKNDLLIKNSSSGEMTIYSVSKADEGLYKCRISDVGESAESWLAVREICPPPEDSCHIYLLLRTVSTVVLVPLLLLLVGLMHCGRLGVPQK